jgi:hypothetical protein
MNCAEKLSTMKYSARCSQIAMLIVGLTAICVIPTLRGGDKATTVAISRIGAMPNLPQPYAMRDWVQVTRDYLDLIFDFDHHGEYLPLVSWLDDNHKMVALPSYVAGPHDPEAINYLAAVISGSLIGLDMRDFRGHDWVAMSGNFYNVDEGVYVNSLRGQTGKSFWYDILPNVFAYQLNAFYPQDAELNERSISVAEKWRDVCRALVDSHTNAKFPNFDHTGFRLSTMQPAELGWIEPEAAAGIAWIEYMASVRFHDARFIEAADLALRALENRPADRSALYEVLLPYSVITAVRMNCEQNRSYDVSKLLSACFDPHAAPQARPGWGVISDRWSGLDAYGLVGSTTDGDGYAFAMNTFQWAGALAPVARYDTRYAHDIGKWMLNLANAARLFYPGTFDAEHQSSFDWCTACDQKSTIAYEGIRKWKRGASTATADVRTKFGKITKGTFASTRFRNESPPDKEVLAEESSSDGQFEHVWEIDAPQIADRWLVVDAKRIDGGHANNEFQFSVASEPDGSFTPLFSVADSEPPHLAKLPPELRDKVYVKVASASPATSSDACDRLSVDAMAITYRDALGPFAQGDAVVSFVDLIDDARVPIVLYRPANVATDLGLYGSSQVGILGGIVRPTNVSGILQLDLLKTDYFHQPAYPTYLYYNPHDSTQNVEIDVGPKPKDLYDAAVDQVVTKNVSGATSFSMAPDTARVITVVPAGLAQHQDGKRTLIGDIVVRYSN